MSNIVLKNVRLSYEHVFVPVEPLGGGEPKYSASLIIDKSDSANVDKLKKAIEEAMQEGVAKKWGGKKPARLQNPLHDGDVDREGKPEYEGCYFINASGKRQPQVVLRYLDPVLKKPIDATPNDVYSGCYCNVSVSLFPYSAAGNNGIGVGLNNIQKWEDGDRLGGASSAAQDFDFETQEVDLDDMFA